MKKLLISSLLSFFITLCFSQNNNRIRTGFTVEPFIGFSISTFIEENAPESSYLQTSAYGINGNYFFTDTWSLKLGVIKDKMGGSLFGLTVTSPDGTLSIISERLEQDFITIPLQANWHFGKNKRWNLAFGGAYSISTGEKLNISGQINSNFSSFAFDIAYKFPLPVGYLKISSASIIRIKEQNSTIYDTQRRGLFSLGYEYHLK